MKNQEIIEFLDDIIIDISSINLYFLNEKTKKAEETKKIIRKIFNNSYNLKYKLEENNLKKDMKLWNKEWKETGKKDYMFCDLNNKNEKDFKICMKKKGRNISLIEDQINNIY